MTWYVICCYVVWCYIVLCWITLRYGIRCRVIPYGDILKYIIVRVAALVCIMLYHRKPSYIELHCISLNWMALPCITFHVITIHYIALHSITLHCNALHYIRSYHTISGRATWLHNVWPHENIMLSCVMARSTPRYDVLCIVVLHCIAMPYVIS